MANSLKDSFQKINILLENATSIALTSHENPDADAIASVLSLHLALKQKNINSFPFFPEKLAKSFSFLPGFFEINNSISSPENFDFIFCLDCGDLKRLKVDISADFPEEKIITIDHHPGGRQEGFLKVVQPEFSSTAEIIYFLLKESQIAIDKDIATCLLTGIIADSGGFQNIATTSQTFKVVADLLLKGVALKRLVNQTLFLERSLEILKIWGKVLQRMEIDEKKGFVYSWAAFDELKDFNAEISDLAGLTNMLLTASGANLALFLAEYEKGKVKGSFRAKPFVGDNPGKSIRPIAEFLGGGGHPYASGFKQEGDIKEILGKVCKLIK